MTHKYYEPFDAAHYAGLLNLSVSRFNHLFKEKMNESPLRYYTLLRLRNAEQLLKYTDYSIAAVAAAVGYEDPMYFDRVFKKHLNCTPLNYRKMFIQV